MTKNSLNTKVSEKGTHTFCSLIICMSIKCMQKIYMQRKKELNQKSIIYFIYTDRKPPAKGPIAKCGVRELLPSNGPPTS